MFKVKVTLNDRGKKILFSSVDFNVNKISDIEAILKDHGVFEDVIKSVEIQLIES